MGNHSLIGASSAERWVACPGSPNLIRKAPEPQPNIYAAEGSAAHKLAEDCLINGKTPDDFLGEVIEIGDFEFEVTEEMCAAVQVYLDVAAEEEGDWKCVVEEHIDLSRLFPGLFGTADLVKLNLDERKLKVIDYKHGKGYVVSPEENMQAMYYALGAIESIFLTGRKDPKSFQIDDPLIFGWDEQFDEIELIIVQPRARHISGPVRKWIVPKGRLNAFQDELVEAAKKTVSPNAPRFAGPHCRFCPALAICDTQMKLIEDSTQADFKPIAKKQAPVLPVAEGLSIDQLVGVLKHADQISSWLKAVEAHAFSMLSHGEEVPGYKLVKKKAYRRWTDKEKAKEFLSMCMTDEEMLTTPDLKSPAQIEKALKKADRDLIKPFIETPDTGNTIADDTDPREAINGGSVATDFTKIN